MKKILLAENDAFLINIYTSQLRKSGCSTSVVSDGELVVSRIKKINPDLLILDDALPKIGGLSVLKIIRKDTSLEELRVVVLSNFNREINDDRELGIIKSFIKSENTAEEIAEEIKKILN